MKRSSSIIFALCVSATVYAEIQIESTSQTYLFIAPIFTTLPARINSWQDSWFDLGKNTAFQVNTQYRRSHDSSKMKRHFLMANRDALTIRGSANTSTSPVTDVRADWLGLPTTFQGTFTVKPEHEQFCMSVSARQSFTIKDVSFLERMWGFVELPLVWTRNDLNFAQEAVTNAGATTATVYDIETAFNNPAWNYQKIKTTRDSKINLGEVRIGFGKTFISDGRAHLISYSAISIPTTKKQNNEYIFSPHVGLNGHFAMITGVSIQLPITRKADTNTTSLYLDFENTYMIRNSQYRTFDLKDKEWSRFLLFREKDQVTNTTVPGVNVLTQKARISPYSLVNVAAGLRFYVGAGEGEIGFGVHGHNQERIRLNNTWQEIYGIAGSTTNTSASASTIKTLGADDAAFTPVKETDIDLNSAASPATLVYRGHVAFGMHGRDESANALSSIGMFIEIPSNKTKAFSQWGLWAKLGAAF